MRKRRTCGRVIKKNSTSSAAITERQRGMYTKISFLSIGTRANEVDRDAFNRTKLHRSWAFFLSHWFLVPTHAGQFHDRRTLVPIRRNYSDPTNATRTVSRRTYVHRRKSISASNLSSPEIAFAGDRNVGVRKNSWIFIRDTFQENRMRPVFFFLTNKGINISKRHSLFLRSRRRNEIVVKLEGLISKWKMIHPEGN